MRAVGTGLLINSKLNNPVLLFLTLLCPNSYKSTNSLSIEPNWSAFEKQDCKKSDDLTKIKNRSTRACSKATTKSINKSTKSTGHSAVTATLSDPVNALYAPLCTPTGVLSLADIRQNAYIQQKVGQRIKELQQLSNSGMDSKIKSLRGGTVDILCKTSCKVAP